MKHITTTLSLTVSGLLASACGWNSAHAVPVLYTLTAVASGSVGSTTFTNSLLTFTSLADTSTVLNTGPGIFRILPSSSQVAIAGLGVATFTIPTAYVSNQNLSRIVLSSFSQNLAIVFGDNPAYASYGLTTAIGPLSGPSGINGGTSFATSLGGFALNSIGTSTFSAVLNPVPEPAPAAMLLLGLATVGVALRRRF